MIAVVLALVAGVVAAAIAHGRPAYQSRTSILVDATANIEAPGDAGNLVALSLFRQKYEALATTSAVAGPVATELGIPEARVAGAVTTIEPTGSFLFSIIATDKDPRLAERMSQAVATELSTYASREQTAAGIQPGTTYKLAVLGPPSAATRESTKDAAKVGLATAVVVFLAAQLLLQLPGRRE